MKRLIIALLMLVPVMLFAQVGKFTVIEVPAAAAPSVKTNKLYAIGSHLYWNNLRVDTAYAGGGTVDTARLATRWWAGQTFQPIGNYAAINHNHAGVYETVISKSTGFLKWNGSAWSWDNSTYATPGNIAGLASSDSLIFGIKSGAIVPKYNADIITGGATSGYGKFQVRDTLKILNRHAFEDYSILRPTSTPSYGYCSFDASPNLSSVQNNSHFAGYQSRLTYGGSGTVGYLHGYDTYMTHNGAGTITEATQIYLKDVLGAGPITNNYGLLIEPITRGITTNWNIYSYGGSQYLGGYTQLIHPSSEVLFIGAAGTTDVLPTFASTTAGAQIYGNAWAVRTGSAYDYNLDVYNNGSPLTAHKITNDGKSVFANDISVTANSGYAAISAGKSLTALNRHAFDDYSILTPASSSANGYASFDASATLTGTHDASHFTSYQSRITFSGSGNITDHMTGYESYMTHSGSGVIKNANQLYLKDVAGAGHIKYNYGLYIEPILRGDSANYNIYSYGGRQLFGGITTMDSPESKCLYIGRNGTTDVISTFASTTSGAQLYGNAWALRTGTDFSFNIDTYNDATPKTALKVLQNGNLELATSKLDFKASTGSKIYAYNDGTYTSGISVGTNSDLLRLFADDYNKIISFGSQTGAGVFTEGMRLSAGKVGIGTQTPGTALDVNGVITATGGTSTDWNAKEPGISKSTGFLKWNGSAWSWDNSTYVTGTPWTAMGYVTGTPWTSMGYVTGTPWTSANTSGTAADLSTLLSLAHGGTAANLTANNGGIVYSNATTLAILGGTATAGKALLSGSSTTPVWSTPTYPSASGASGKILISDGTNNGYSAFTMASPGTSGNVLKSDGTNWTSSADAGSMTYPGAGIPVSTGSAWASSITGSNGYSLRFISNAWRAWPDSVGTGGGTSYVDSNFVRISGAAYASASTFTVTGTQIKADMMYGSLMTWQSTAGAIRYGFISNATVSGGTITATCYGTAAMASGDKNYYYGPQLKARLWERRITIPGVQIADASNPQGMWFQGNPSDTLAVFDVSAWVLTAASGTGAALTYNLLHGTTKLFTSDLSFGTNASVLDQTPTAVTLVPPSVNLSLRIYSSAGATTFASDFQCRYFAVPTRIFWGY